METINLRLCASLLFHFVQERRAEDQGAAGELQRRHRLAEDQPAHEDRRERIDVAQRRRGLGGQAAQRREVHQISQPGVNQAQSRQAEPARAVQTGQRDAPLDKHVGSEKSGREQQLGCSGLVRRDAAQEFVGHDRAGVEDGRADAAGNAEQVVPPRAAAAPHDAGQTAQRDEDAEDRTPCQFFAQQPRRKTEHEHGGQIITDRARGDRRPAERLEEQDQVHAYKSAGHEQVSGVSADPFPREPVAHRRGRGEQTKAADGGAQQRDLRRRKRDAAREQADGTEDQHGPGHKPFH